MGVGRYLFSPVIKADLYIHLYFTKTVATYTLIGFSHEVWLAWIVFTHAGVGIASRRVCLCVCVSVCQRFNRKTTRAINTKLGIRILYSGRSACIDPEVKRSKVKVTKTVTAQGC